MISFLLLLGCKGISAKSKQGPATIKDGERKTTAPAEQGAV